MIKQIKAHLNNSIQSIIGQKVEFVKQDEQAFTRKRSLSLETMICTILGMGGKSLSKELLDARLTVSNLAFVQRRYQIKPEAFYALLKEFTAPIPLNTDFPIFATDGSDVCIPRNPMDSETSVQTQTDVKSYNLIHINGLYDLATRVYRDVSIQDKHRQHDRLALIQMMEAMKVTISWLIFKKKVGFTLSEFEMGNNLCIPPSTCQIQSVLIKHFL